VIQEALRNNRPVICSNIGGMAEKIQDGIDGFHFPVGSSLGLSHLLVRLHADRILLQNVRDTMQFPDSVENVLSRHLMIYRHNEAWADAPVEA
jgi:glycosyltransferase involved in cell wall biosynthesis